MRCYVQHWVILIAHAECVCLCVCVCVCVCVCLYVCGTHSLKGLEDAVEEKVPDDFAILIWRNIPYEEIGKHSQRGWEHDPAEEQRRDNNNNISGCPKTWAYSCVRNIQTL